MAAEKKKADPKKSDKKSDKSLDKKLEKKPVKKVVASTKSGVQKGKKKLTETNVKIMVPRGGQVIKYFSLTPALPTETEQGDWLFTEEGSTQDIENLVIGFELNPSPLERQLERAVLVVNIVQDPAVNGTWRFALGGIATDYPDADPANDMSVDIIDHGYTMVVYVQALENTLEYIPFSFVASLADRATGRVSVYESQDPGIIPVRPVT